MADGHTGWFNRNVKIQRFLTVSKISGFHCTQKCVHIGYWNSIPLSDLIIVHFWILWTQFVKYRLQCRRDIMNWRAMWQRAVDGSMVKGKGWAEKREVEGCCYGDQKILFVFMKSWRWRNWGWREKRDWCYQIGKKYNSQPWKSRNTWRLDLKMFNFDIKLWANGAWRETIFSCLDIKVDKTL